MRILQTPPRFYPRKGGIEEAALQLSRQLVVRGHEVTVVCPDDPPSRLTETDGIRLIKLPFAATISNTPLAHSMLPVLLKQRFDIVHAHLPHPWNPEMSVLASMLKRRPMVLSYYNDIVATGAHAVTAGIYNRLVLPFVLWHSKRIFVLHQGYVSNCPSLAKHRRRIVVAPPGTRPPVHTKKECHKEAPVFLFVSRLDAFHRYKGLHVLLRAAEGLRKDRRFSIKIAGEGELLDQHQASVKVRGLSDIVEFIGGQSDDMLSQAYAFADVLVLPSLSAKQEGFGLVAIEAMAHGTPVIVSSVVGCAEDIEDENAGIVVRPDDAVGLEAAMRSMIDDFEKRITTGENGKELVAEKYTWMRHADIVEQEYRRIVRKRNSRCE